MKHLVQCKSSLTLAVFVAVTATGGKKVKTTLQERDSVTCSESRMNKRAQSFVRGEWLGAATGSAGIPVSRLKALPWELPYRDGESSNQAQ